MMRHDSPIALFEVAQAVTMHRFGPRNPNSIEMRPLAMLLMSIGMVKAETRDGPLLTRALCWSSSVFSPPMPLLTMTPKRSRFTFSRSIPESRIRHFRGGHGELREAIGPLVTSFGFLKNCLRIEIAHLAADPAIVAAGIEARDLDDAADAFLQIVPENVARSLPNGVTTPSPVMTTLRSFM